LLRSEYWPVDQFVLCDTHEASLNRYGKDIVADLPKILTHGEYSKHASLSPFPPLALKAPVVEVMVAYFPSGISQANKDAASARFHKFQEQALAKCRDVLGVAIGWGVEDDFPINGGKEGEKGTALFAAIGWDSVDKHMAFRETNEFKKNVSLLTDMEGMLKITMIHVELRCVEREGV
jgi:hypothetical protein